MATRRALKSASAIPFRRVEGLPEDVQRFQRAAEESSEAARRNPAARSVTVRVKPAAAGPLTFSHKLGRKPQSYEAISQKGTAITWTEELVTTRFLRLNFSAAGDVTFRVY